MSNKQTVVLVGVVVVSFLAAIAMADVCDQCIELVKNGKVTRMELELLLKLLCLHHKYSDKVQRCIDRIDKILPGSSKTPRQVCKQIGLCKKASLHTTASRSYKIESQ